MSGKPTSVIGVISPRASAWPGRQVTRPGSPGLRTSSGPDSGSSTIASPSPTRLWPNSSGLVQQQYVVTNPDFYPQVPSLATLNGLAVQQVIEKVSPTLRAPYLVQSAVAFERQLPAHTTVAVTFADTHGLHQLRSQDINAPLPGTYDPQVTGSGVFPLGNPNSVFLMESAGLYNQTQLITNFNSQASKNVSLFGSYLYNHAMSNTDSLGTFPANPYKHGGGIRASGHRHSESSDVWRVHQYAPGLSVQPVSGGQLWLAI